MHFEIKFRSTSRSTDCGTSTPSRNYPRQHHGGTLVASTPLCKELQIRSYL